MANTALPNMALKNDLMARNYALENLLLVGGEKINEDDSIYYSDSEEDWLDSSVCFSDGAEENSHDSLDPEDEDSLYFSDSEEEELYTKMKSSIKQRMVVPMTAQWMSALQTNLDDGLGPTLILGKFLRSLSKCELKTLEWEEGNDQIMEYEGVDLQGNLTKMSGTTSNMMIQTEQASVSNTGPVSSTYYPSSRACLLPDKDCAGDTQEFKEKAGFYSKLDLEDWIYEFDSEDWKFEELMEYSSGPDADIMEETLAGFVDQKSQYCSEEFKLIDPIELLFLFDNGLLGHNSITTEGLMGYGPSADEAHSASIYESDEDDWMAEEPMGCSFGPDDDWMAEEPMGCSFGPDDDDMEERQVLQTYSVSDDAVVQTSDHSSEEEFTLLDPIKLLHRFDNGLLGNKPMVTEGLLGTEEAEAVYDYCYKTDGSLDQWSDYSEEVEFKLLDPIELLYSCDESIVGHQSVTTYRLSRYDLHYGPTHRVQSPSCPLIGVRGDSRERSVYSDNVQLPSLPAMAPQYQHGNVKVVRTDRGKTVKTSDHKFCCHTSHTDPFVSPPSPGSLWWLLLMGVASLVTVKADVKQRLGKLLEKSHWGRPHRQPRTQENKSYNGKHSRWKTYSLFCLRLSSQC